MKNFSLGVKMLVLIFMMLCLFTESLRVPPYHHGKFIATSFNSPLKTLQFDVMIKLFFASAASIIHGRATKFGDEGQVYPEEGVKEVLGMELYPTGSSLPDCSHACGPCFPCKRVMVSFKCSIAESCPIVYRCMCKGKYYHVPSN
ncbi:hypothetical protein DITRI_Ditri05aG0158600 [Diplodiscus trichospermus]